MDHDCSLSYWYVNEEDSDDIAAAGGVVAVDSYKIVNTPRALEEGLKRTPTLPYARMSVQKVYYTGSCAG
jgi:hypothetical protein